MNKNKSKSAYTNKWLNRNRHLWREVEMTDSQNSFIGLLIMDAPKIVINCVNEINNKRRYSFLYDDHRLPRYRIRYLRKYIKNFDTDIKPLIKFIDDDDDK